MRWEEEEGQMAGYDDVGGERPAYYVMDVLDSRYFGEGKQQSRKQLSTTS